LFCLPATSAEVERGFSQLKLVKTNCRSRMKSSTLSDQLMLILESPDIKDFDPEPAIHLWNHSDRSRRRRPAGYKPRA